MQKTYNGKNNNNQNTSYSKVEDLPKKNILGVDVTDASPKNILEFIVKSLQKFQNPYYIVTPNPEMIVLARKDAAFKAVLNNAKIATNDGVGLSLAAHILGKPFHGRFTGVGLVEKLCEMVQDWPITVGFLGAGPKVAEETSKCLIRRYPKLEIVFADDHWFGESSAFRTKESVIGNRQSMGKNREKNDKRYPISPTLQHIDVLFVAFGFPKQEFWMAEHVGKIPVKVMVGVGGAFDQIANSSLRPPKFLQNLGLGWFYRLVRQPWRWKRQLALLEFVGMVFLSVISKERSD